MSAQGAFVVQTLNTYLVLTAISKKPEIYFKDWQKQFKIRNGGDLNNDNAVPWKESVGRGIKVGRFYPSNGRNSTKDI